MTILTYNQALQTLKSFYQTYLPTYTAKYSAWQEDLTQLFSGNLQSGLSLKASYDYAVASAMALAASFEKAYPSNPAPSGGDMTDPISFVNKFPPSEVVNYFYPDSSAADKDSLVKSIISGSLTPTDLGSAISILKPSIPNPSVDQIKGAADILTGAANLPDANLHFPGVSDAQLHFVTSMYIGAFGRTPEYEGHKFWSGELASNLSNGMTQSAAFASIGQHIYKAGAQNGESGTTLDNAGYVTFAYNNALGRAADKAGYDYWVNNLNSGGIDRGDFLSTFLTAGMNSERDSNFLVGRIAVGEFAAQQHVSGAGAPGIDPKAILNGVTDITSAAAVINGIIAQYGTSPANIELVGHSQVQVDTII